MPLADLLSTPARFAAVVYPKPCPPRPREPVGRLLIDEGYVGWVLITTPRKIRKVRFVARDGYVYRDDQCRAGGAFRVEVHAVSCRVEPCLVLAAASPVTLPADELPWRYRPAVVTP